MNQIQKPLAHPVITGRPQTPAVVKPNQTQIDKQAPAKSFASILEQSLKKNTEVTFSKHAQARNVERGISLSDEDIQKLESAVEQAGDKGITDTLIFMNNTAFIVNVPNRVVVTVVGGTETNNSVFTNINGAVIV